MVRPCIARDRRSAALRPCRPHMGSRKASGRVDHRGTSRPRPPLARPLHLALSDQRRRASLIGDALGHLTHLRLLNIVGYSRGRLRHKWHRTSLVPFLTVKRGASHGAGLRRPAANAGPMTARRKRAAVRPAVTTVKRYCAINRRAVAAVDRGSVSRETRLRARRAIRRLLEEALTTAARRAKREEKRGWA